MDRPDNVAVEERLFEGGRQDKLETAKACLVYSLVPLLGIIFIPMALAAAAYYSVRSFGQIGRRDLVKFLFLTVLVAAGQLGLWWLMFLIPEIASMP